MTAPDGFNKDSYSDVSTDLWVGDGDPGSLEKEEKEKAAT